MAARSGILTYMPERHMWPAPANSFLLEDSKGVVLIEAGCGFPECWSRLREFLSDNGYAPSDVHTLFLSHAHPDHMGAVPFLLKEASPRVLIHEIEAPYAREPALLNLSFDMSHITDYYRERLDASQPPSIDIISYFENLCPMGAVEATEVIKGGDVLELGGRRFQVVETPGHSPGHVSLFEPEDGTLLTFDLVGAVVAWYCPSGGGAKSYLSSLSRIEALGARLILPSHGTPMTDVRGAVSSTREVLLGRERKVLEILKSGPARLLEITDALFPNENVRMFPGLQITHSHLIKLEEEGRVSRGGTPGDPLFQLA